VFRYCSDTATLVVINFLCKKCFKDFVVDFQESANYTACPDLSGDLKNQHFVGFDKQAVLLVRFGVLVFWWQLNCYWNREKIQMCKSAERQNVHNRTHLPKAAGRLILLQQIPFGPQSNALD